MMLGSCGSAGHGPAPSPSGSPSASAQETLLPTVPPPLSVPSATLVAAAGRQHGLLLAARWAGSTGQVTESTPRMPVRWPAPVRRRDTRLAVLIGTPVAPVRVELRSYSAVDSRTGVPKSVAEPQLCQAGATPGAACSVHPDGRHITVTANAIADHYIVLYAEWYVPAQLRQNPSVSTYTGSWGFRSS
jgi:hypothetical protein